MHISLQREILLKPIEIAISAVEKKPPLPILYNVLFSIKDGQLLIKGSDGEIELMGKNELIGDNFPNTELTLPAKKLLDICRALPEKTQIDLSGQKENVIISSKKSRFRLATLPAENFPSLTLKGENLSFTMLEKQLKILLQRSYFAMAQQDLRYYLNGLLLEINANQIRVVATDGHRLALSTASLSVNVAQTMQVILPRKAVIALVHLLEENDQTIGVTLSDNHIRITAERFLFTSKLLEGIYPDYERAIPQQNNKTIVLERDILKRALNRAAVICNDHYRGVRFEIANNLLTISTTNPEQEFAQEEIPVQFDEAQIDIAFNIHYLIDIISVIKKGEISLNFHDGKTSVIVKEIENPWKSIFVVMPIHL